MSLTAVGAVASWPVLDARLRGLAYELANCHNAESGKCHPSHKYLASRCDVSIRTVIRMLNDLDGMGIIKIVHTFNGGRQQTNEYKFIPCMTERGVTDDTPEGVTDDTPEGVTSVIQNQEEETGRGNNTRTADADGATDLEFEKEFSAFWVNYPKKVDKKKARTAFKRLTKKKRQFATADCLTRYRGVEKRFVPNPTTYIHGERWEDENPNVKPQQPTYTPPRTLRPEEWMPDVGEREPLSPEEYAKGKAAIDRLLKARRERQH